MDRGRDRYPREHGKGGKGKGKGDRSGSRGPPQRSGSRGPPEGRSSSYEDRRYNDRNYGDRKGNGKIKGREYRHDDRDFGKGKGNRGDYDYDRGTRSSSRGGGDRNGFRDGGKKGGKGGKKGSKGKKGFDRQSWIRRQIEFYLSSENLNVDGKTLAAFDGAWISLDYVLDGPRLAAKNVSEDEALRALGHSRTVEFKRGRNGYLLSVVDAPTDEDTRLMKTTLRNWQRTVRNDPHAMETGLMGKWASGDVRRMKHALSDGRDTYDDRRRDSGRDSRYTNDRSNGYSNRYSNDNYSNGYEGGRRSNGYSRGRYEGYETD
eukprot:TRINITY_DN3010_c0_g1_i1.p1 TRINITY_DN3010_c0_g1~~TRINITY_DN3010_c0_g1_i1.p1  ORF type:complete len:332 (+),score=58.79 TRINITY_DN3010_c0_g1_i1:44-997(+)